MIRLLKPGESAIDLNIYISNSFLNEFRSPQSYCLCLMSGKVLITGLANRHSSHGPALPKICGKLSSCPQEGLRDLKSELGTFRLAWLSQWGSYILISLIFSPCLFFFSQHQEMSRTFEGACHFPHPWQGVGTRWSLRSLLSQTSVWFCNFISDSATISDHPIPDNSNSFSTLVFANFPYHHLHNIYSHSTEPNQPFHAPLGQGEMTWKSLLIISPVLPPCSQPVAVWRPPFHLLQTQQMSLGGDRESFRAKDPWPSCPGWMEELWLCFLSLLTASHTHTHT